MTVLSFLLPLAVWCVVSYVPFVWHPMVRVTDAGDTFLAEGKLYDRVAFADANAEAFADGEVPAVGVRANPVFLPAPHDVVHGLYEAFTRPPQLRDDQWFHQSIYHSLRILFLAFFHSVLIGVPLGVLCGTFAVVSRLLEPVVDFVRYMPAPVFGALAVAVLGLADAPKIAIIFIGTFFQMVLVVANTTRQVDTALLEAAQTLGASNRSLVTRVIIPSAMPNLFNDLRILLGWAWTYLIIAELIGAKSGITAYISQQSRYFNYDLVFAAILIIGLLGLTTDQLLQIVGRRLFPWAATRRTPRRTPRHAPRRRPTFVTLPGGAVSRLRDVFRRRPDDPGRYPYGPSRVRPTPELPRREEVPDAATP